MPRSVAAGAVAILLAGLLLLYGCAPDRSRLESTEPDADIVTLGPETVYAVGAVVPDSVTGGEFVFPEGGSGTLTVARILTSATPAPDEADGFFVEYDGEERMHYREARQPDARLVLWILGRPDCSTSTPPSPHGDWLAVMPVDTLSDPVVFELTQPGYPPAADVFTTRRGDAAPTLPLAPRGPADRQAPRPINSYYIMRKHIPANGTLATNLGVIVAIAQWTMNDLIRALPTAGSLRQTVDTRHRGTHALEGWKGMPSGLSAYSGFRWWLRRTIRETRPYFQWVATGSMRATESTIAHECGHYLTHLMVGDDVFAQLEGQRQLSHDFAKVNPGRPMLEEYAQFADYFKNGNVGARHQVEEPVHAMRKATPGLDPANVDWPALEGYATCLLARLMSTSGTIHGLSGSAEDIPAIGLSAEGAFGILGNGQPRLVDDLRVEVQLALAGRADALPAILERTGWSYHGTGRVIDDQGRRISGALVQNVCKVPSEGGREYLAPLTPVTTDDRGNYTIPRMFPGTTHLRVTVNGVARDFPVFVDAIQPTDVGVKIPDVRLTASSRGRFRIWIVARRTWTTILQPEGIVYGPSDDLIDTWTFQERYLPGVTLDGSGFTVDYDSTWTDQYGYGHRFAIQASGTFDPGGGIRGGNVAFMAEDIRGTSRFQTDCSFALSGIPLESDDGGTRTYQLSGAGCGQALLEPREDTLLTDLLGTEYGKWVLNAIDWQPASGYTPRILIVFAQ